MPRACTICAHPDRKTIDAMIADKQPFLQIATKYGLNQRTVNTHGKNHVLPFIDKIEQDVQAVVMERVLGYRDQVNLPLPEKSKFVEDGMWGTLGAAENVTEQMSVIREIQKQQAEQAKLAGAYQQDAKNKTDMEKIVEVYRSFERHYPDASPEARDTWVSLLAESSGVSALEIRNGIGVQTVDGVQ